jgi:DNA-directed RNA polymerase II subunit RPB1
MERNLCPHKDTMVRIHLGELLSGMFNKATVGSAGGGIIHIIWKECGPKICSDFLSNSQLIINQWIIYNGHTVGI